jgi:maleate isomerase
MDPTIPLEPVRRFAEPPHVDDAAELLAAAPVNVITYGFTSSAYVVGVAGEAEMISRLERCTRGIPVVSPCAAAVQALHALGAGAQHCSTRRGSTRTSTPWARPTTRAPDST